MIYRIYAALCLTAFYGIYFIKMLRQRHRGIKTDQMGVGDKDSNVKTIELVTKISAITVVISEVLSIILTSPKIYNEIRFAGAVCCLVGVGMFYAAVKTMGRSWRAGITDDKTRLVTTGIFSISRNPAFLAFDLTYLGILLMFFNFLLLIFTLFAAVMLHLQILNEEKHLEEKFGEEYLRYKEKTGRYFSA